MTTQGVVRRRYEDELALCLTDQDVQRAKMIQNTGLFRVALYGHEEVKSTPVPTPQQTQETP